MGICLHFLPRVLHLCGIMYICVTICIYIAERKRKKKRGLREERSEQGRAKRVRVSK